MDHFIPRNILVVGELLIEYIYICSDLILAWHDNRVGKAGILWPAKLSSKPDKMSAEPKKLDLKPPEFEYPTPQLPNSLISYIFIKMGLTKAQRTARKAQGASQTTHEPSLAPTPTESTPTTSKTSPIVRNYVLKANVTADGGKLLYTLTKSLKKGEFDFHDFNTTHVAKALEASSRNKLVYGKADIRHSGSKDGVELTVEDPDQWKNLEEVLDAYMSNNKKTWVVTYNVKYSKKEGDSSSKVLHVPTDDDSDLTEGSEHESLNEDNNKKKLGKRVCFLFLFEF
jgi:hypothetical protein